MHRVVVTLAAVLALAGCGTEAPPSAGQDAQQADGLNAASAPLATVWQGEVLPLAGTASDVQPFRFAILPEDGRLQFETGGERLVLDGRTIVYTTDAPPLGARYVGATEADLALAVERSPVATRLMRSVPLIEFAKTDEGRAFLFDGVAPPEDFGFTDEDDAVWAFVADPPNALWALESLVRGLRVEVQTREETPAVPPLLSFELPEDVSDVSDQLFPRVVEERDARLVGTSLPAFEFETFEGETLRSEDLLGQTVVVDFWAIWCPPCLEALPELEAMQPQLEAAGARLVGINVDTGENLGRAAQWLAQNSITFPSAKAGGSGYAEDLGVQVYPTTLIVNPEGQITEVMRGGYGPKENLLNMISKPMQ